MTLSIKEYDKVVRKFVDDYVDNKVTTIVNASVDYQDSELLQEWEDLFDVHTILGETKQEYERKLQIAQAKQPKAEW